MMPSGAVIPEPTYQLSVPLGDLLGPIVMLALLFIGAALVAIVAGAAMDLRKCPVSTGIAAGDAALGTADKTARASRHAA